MSWLADSLPDDFCDFWIEAAHEAMAFPLEFERTRQTDVSTPGFLIEAVDFRGSTGNVLHGWMAYHAGAYKDPGFVWLPPYGRESMLPNEYGTRHGFVSLSFNFHGLPAFHREKYEPSRGYFAEGAADPETWIFRRLFKDAIIATRLLSALPETDGGRIGVMGMSQGGGIAIWLGAWCEVVKAVCADMPFLGNIAATVASPVYRYPMKELIEWMETIPLGRERLQNTVAYYDTALMAAFCKVPTQVSLGLKDPAARPEQVHAIFDNLPGSKNLIEYPIGHDWTPPMVENNRTFLLDRMPER